MIEEQVTGLKLADGYGRAGPGLVRDDPRHTYAGLRE